MAAWATYRAEQVAAQRCPALRGEVPDPQSFVDFVTAPAGGLFRKLRESFCEPCLHETSVTITYGDPQQHSVSRARHRAQHIDLAHGCTPTNGHILHELAHLCSPSNEGHGLRWAANLLLLVREYLGASAAEVMLQSFREAGLYP